MPTNHLGQPIGEPLPDWVPPPFPPPTVLVGRICRVEPLDVARHAEALFEANAYDQEQRNWTYLGVGPFADFAAYQGWLESVATVADPQFYSIVHVATGQAVGISAYLRITPEFGSIEIGHVNFSPLLQRTPLATEAMYLLMANAFALGYRRYEWKCDALNAPSRAAAQRFGFAYEGVFRQAMVYKGRTRDTAWFSVIDREWPALCAAFEQWLDQANFDAAGQQRVRLSELTAPLLARRDPV